MCGDRLWFSTDEKRETKKEEDNGGSVWQNKKATVKAKKETEVLTKPAHFSTDDTGEKKIKQQELTECVGFNLKHRSNVKDK